MDPRPESTRRGLPTVLVVWLSAIGAVIILEYADNVLETIGRGVAVVDIFSFFAWLVAITLTIYGVAVAVRWVLTKLFWTVGRRLFLSYLLIGLLPFFIMSILLLTIAYMFAAVMTQAAVRAERQATLGQMETWALEYAMTGKRPPSALRSLEIYDSADQQVASRLPDWLETTTFSGVVDRDGKPLLVTSRRFPARGTVPERAVVFVQPIDLAWADQVHEQWGMVVRTAGASRSDGNNINIDGDEGIGEIVLSNAFRRIIWGDIANLTSWETGQELRDRSLFTLIVNPPGNLLSYYFGSGAHEYFDILVSIIAALAVILMMMYAVAAMFAAFLIFSISRAVNRIEKGTHAVERGDFSYRIGMKRRNQLGAMAQSFDQMTASIGSLLATVAEKERLQSEIEIAASIQRNLLPKEGPQFRGVSFSAHFEPTASIGGDYYDVFNLDKSRLAVAIGDVSGHGLSTGLVMAMVKAAITTLVEEGADESSLFHRLNDLVYRSTERRAFMTLAFTIFDLDRGTIRHTNAGHLYPYLLRGTDGTPLPIESPSLPLGVKSTINAHTVEVSLEAGDTIVYLSDGIVEAQDERGDPMGFDHLETLLAEHADRSPESLRNAILAAVARHSGSRAADDDRTVMVLRFDNLRTAPESQPQGAPAAVAG